MPDSPMNAVTGPLGVIVTLNGQPMSDATMLHSVRVARELGRIPTAVVSILSDKPQVFDFEELDDDAFKIGTEIELSGFWGDGSAQDLFKGVVMSMRLRLNPQVGQMLELTCRDKALTLLELRTSGQFSDKKDSDVMTSLITDAGLKADVVATEAQHDQVCVGSSAWQTIQLLADRNGLVIDVYDGTVRVFKPEPDGSAKLKVTFGSDMMEFDAQISAQRMIGGATYSSWDTTAQELVEGSDTTLSDPKLGNISAGDIADVLGKRTFNATIGADLDSAALKTLASARLVRASLDAVSGSCSYSGSNLGAPGDVIEIADAGNRFSGMGFISGVTHKIGVGDWTTKVRMGLPLDWVSDSHDVTAPGAGAIATPMSGLHIGKVIQVHDDPDSQQRILISLPAIGAPEVQVWARLGTPYATATAGIQFLPEIDDEVLVGFLNDDPNAPVILGALHNPTAERPIAAIEDNFIKKIITKEQLAITFDDEKKILTVETPGGHKITLDDDATNIVLEDSGGSTVTLDNAGITLKTDGDITLDAGGDVNITAAGDANIGGVNVTCDADTGFTGKGGAQAEVSSGGQTTVKGSIVMIN